MSEEIRSWTFFSNHAHVYFLLARNQNLIMREIAQAVGITERAVKGIIDDLESSGYIEKIRVGRNNEYKICPNTYLRHPLEAEVALDEISSIVKKAMKNK